MKVALVKIQNILGIESLQFEPRGAGITVIRGPNESGKTSVLEAIKSVVEGGHDATLLRQGASEGEVVWVLDDGVEVRKRITAEKSELTVRHPKLGRVGSAKGFLDGLVASGGFNPVEFLQADKRHRVELLLKGMPLQLDTAQLKALVREALDAKAADLDLPADSLEALDAVERRMREERTLANRLARDKSVAAQQLRETLPPDAKSPPEQRELVMRLEAEHEKARNALDAALSENHTHYGLAFAAARDAQKIALDAVKDRLDDELRKATAELLAKIEGLTKTINDLERQRDELRGKLRDTSKQYDVALAQETTRIGEEQRATLAAVAAEKERALEKLRVEHAAEIDRTKTQLAVARSELEAAARHAHTKESIEKASNESLAHEARAEKLSMGLQQLQGLREGLLRDLPVEGLTVREGDIYLKGVPFERMSDAQRIELAVLIAKHNAGELGLVIVDGLERLDPVRFSAFRERVEAWGLQLIATQVADGAFSVNGKGA